MNVVVIGAGIAGLGAALALARGGHQVTVIERDPAPPALSPDALFESWSRKGVSQLRHSHAFLARLTELLKQRHPELLDRLIEAGARPITFIDHLPPALRPNYVAAPGDEMMTILTCRRTTLEATIRREAERRPQITIIDGTTVQDIVLDRTGPIPRLAGVRVSDKNGDREIVADLFVDSAGRHGLVVDRLADAGIRPDEESADAGILYYTRHYRLRDETDEPPRGHTPGAGDLGYIKYGVFPADHRYFSVTLAVPEIEGELRRILPHPEKFDAVCAAIPGAAQWTERGIPASKVFGMGNLKSVWRKFAPGGIPRILGYVALGDAHIRTNPLYGRGCSAAFMQAEILADILAQNPAAQDIPPRFEAWSYREIRPFYDAMVHADGQAIRRAVREQRGVPLRMRARVAQYLADQVLTPAIRGDIIVFRAFLRSFNMIDQPKKFTGNPKVLWRMARFLFRSAASKAHLMPPKLGPDRRDMFVRLGIAPSPQDGIPLPPGRSGRRSD